MNHKHTFKIKSYPFAIFSSIGTLSTYQTKTCICGYSENKVIPAKINILKWQNKIKEQNLC